MKHILIFLLSTTPLSQPKNLSDISLSAVNFSSQMLMSDSKVIECVEEGVYSVPSATAAGV